jgi:hypothetical protein
MEINMKLYTNCLSSELACEESGRFTIALLSKSVTPQPMHTQNSLEIYYGLSDGKYFIIDDIIYPVYENDVFLINQFETHRVESLENHPHDRYIISIMPDYLTITQILFAASKRRWVHHPKNTPCNTLTHLYTDDASGNNRQRQCSCKKRSQCTKHPS